jgi:hypothetical protein
MISYISQRLDTGGIGRNMAAMLASTVVLKIFSETSWVSKRPEEQPISFFSGYTYLLKIRQVTYISSAWILLTKGTLGRLLYENFTERKLRVLGYSNRSRDIPDKHNFTWIPRKLGLWLGLTTDPSQNQQNPNH